MGRRVEDGETSNEKKKDLWGVYNDMGGRGVN